jgi:hypothetical protein
MSAPCPPPLASLPKPTFWSLLAHCQPHQHDAIPGIPATTGFQIRSHEDFMQALGQAPWVVGSHASVALAPPQFQLMAPAPPTLSYAPKPQTQTQSREEAVPAVALEHATLLVGLREYRPPAHKSAQSESASPVDAPSRDSDESKPIEPHDLMFKHVSDGFQCLICHKVFTFKSKV